MPVEKLFPDGLPVVVEGVPPVVVATGRRTFYFTGQIASDSNGDLVYAEAGGVFIGEQPAATMVAVSSLDRGALIEVDMIAVLD